jgi:hypothetical protein
MFHCNMLSTEIRLLSVWIQYRGKERKKNSFLTFLSGSFVRRMCKPEFACEEGDFWLLLSLAQLVSHSADSIYLM